MSAKTSTSKADTYQDIVAFWDEHDATDFIVDESGEPVRVSAISHQD